VKGLRFYATQTLRVSTPDALAPWPSGVASGTADPPQLRRSSAWISYSLAAHEVLSFAWH
jgi:hypothetical protein